MSLGLTEVAVTSTADAWIYKKNLKIEYVFLRFSTQTTLIISNEEMEGIIKIVKSLEESRLLIKGVSETFENKSKEQKYALLGCY